MISESMQRQAKNRKIWSMTKNENKGHQKCFPKLGAKSPFTYGSSCRVSPLVTHRHLMSVTSFHWTTIRFELTTIWVQCIPGSARSEEHTSELQSPDHLVC